MEEKMNKLLTESYPRDQVNEEAMTQFIERMREFFGGTQTLSEVRNKDVIQKSEFSMIVTAHFHPGYPVRLVLKRDQETFEITCTAYRVFNREALLQLSEAELDLLCTLAVQKSLGLIRIPGQKPLNKEEQLLDEQLSYLIPKLMIITGQATEDNFMKG